jgi:hypothetical protein
MNLPFPFFIESAICSSVCAFCHSGFVKSGCPRDRQLGKPTPSLPWHSAHLPSYTATPSAAELAVALDGVLWPLALTISLSGAHIEIAIAADSAAKAKLFFLVIYLLPVLTGQLLYKLKNVICGKDKTVLQSDAFLI